MKAWLAVLGAHNVPVTLRLVRLGHNKQHLQSPSFVFTCLQAIMKAQLASPTFSPLYAALISVVNTKFPELGELLCHRCVEEDKHACKTAQEPLSGLIYFINRGVFLGGWGY
jgi:hypothetical protein